MTDDIDFEKLQSNWEMFEKLCGRLSDDNLNNLVSELGERAWSIKAFPDTIVSWCRSRSPYGLGRVGRLRLCLRCFVGVLNLLCNGSICPLVPGV